MAETKTVEQPTNRPTNKLMTGVGATLLTNVVLRLLEQQGLTQWLGDDTTLLREFVFLAISGLIGLGYAYFFTEDRPNQPELVEELKVAKADARAAERETAIIRTASQGPQP